MRRQQTGVLPASTGASTFSAIGGGVTGMGDGVLGSKDKMVLYARPLDDFWLLNFESFFCLFAFKIREFFSMKIFDEIFHP